MCQTAKLLRNILWGPTWNKSHGDVLTHWVVMTSWPDQASEGGLWHQDISSSEHCLNPSGQPFWSSCFHTFCIGLWLGSFGGQPTSYWLFIILYKASAIGGSCFHEKVHTVCKNAEELYVVCDGVTSTWLEKSKLQAERNFKNHTTLSNISVHDPKQWKHKLTGKCDYRITPIVSFAQIVHFWWPRTHYCYSNVAR